MIVRQIAEVGLHAVFQCGEPRCNGCKFCSGYRCVRSECPIRISPHNIVLLHVTDCIGIPFACRHIAEAVAICSMNGHLFFQQTGEHHCHFCSGHIPSRQEGAFGISYHVSKMIRFVQLRSCNRSTTATTGRLLFFLVRNPVAVFIHFHIGFWPISVLVLLNRIWNSVAILVHNVDVCFAITVDIDIAIRFPVSVNVYIDIRLNRIFRINVFWVDWIRFAITIFVYNIDIWVTITIGINVDIWLSITVCINIDVWFPVAIGINIDIWFTITVCINVYIRFTITICINIDIWYDWIVWINIFWINGVWFAVAVFVHNIDVWFTVTIGINVYIGFTITVCINIDVQFAITVGIDVCVWNPIIIGINIGVWFAITGSIHIIFPN